MVLLETSFFLPDNDIDCIDILVFLLEPKLRLLIVLNSDDLYYASNIRITIPVIIIFAMANGIKTFQPNLINWS